RHEARRHGVQAAAETAAGQKEEVSALPEHPARAANFLLTRVTRIFQKKLFTEVAPHGPASDVTVDASVA
ncbi:MAG TPA: hypothetical protein VHJ00_15530, partial [Bradyrhizobium sp.]|nr:hypothetical protein [Bradyrhizobium sp.]